nr:hypothetical protein [Duncaniella muris]
MACQSSDISCGNGILIGYICDMAYRDAAFWPNLLLDILSAWYISGSLFPFTPYAQARQAPLALSLFFASHFIAPHFVVYCGTFDLSWHFSGDIIF